MHPPDSTDQASRARDDDEDDDDFLRERPREVEDDTPITLEEPATSQRDPAVRRRGIAGDGDDDREAPGDGRLPAPHRR